ncbi:hypothetical protein K1W69_05605 [Hoeflea sp. WL0058]|uniref:Uncharacterized protein n=1 Tax=Flavimaribacter sediminis TaxID=2865987 RepID=A0AAE2ZL55_9HYPH|nr:hypothetical protein [Flavimaribacter sediminis]MBW8636660.1 hypothetical protein [Flavimaribacter sediminis]
MPDFTVGVLMEKMVSERDELMLGRHFPLPSHGTVRMDGEAFWLVEG